MEVAAAAALGPVVVVVGAPPGQALPRWPMPPVQLLSSAETDLVVFRLLVAFVVLSVLHLLPLWLELTRGLWTTPVPVSHQIAGAANYAHL